MFANNVVDYVKNCDSYGNLVCDNMVVGSGEGSSVVCVEEVDELSASYSSKNYNYRSLTQLRNLMLPLVMLNMVGFSNGLGTSFCRLKLEICSLMYTKSCFDNEKTLSPISNYYLPNINV
ncbi:hypothetical protein (partial), partial [Candidatus Ichthyocystis hellenicum]